MNNIKNHITPAEVGIKQGDALYVEKSGSLFTSTTEIKDVSSSLITFYSPRYETGDLIPLAFGETLKFSYWSQEGLKYSFSALVQHVNKQDFTVSVNLPSQLNLEANRRWNRYKPVNLLASFIHKNSNLNDTIHIGRVSNISAGGMLLTTPKRVNVDDIISVGFYAGDTFFSALSIVRTVKASKHSLGENDIALQFTNYTELDKEFLESKLAAYKI